MVRSSWPSARSTVNSQTPTAVPRMPPASSMRPSGRSTRAPPPVARSRRSRTRPRCGSATLATATAGGMPMKISSGVIRKPPPMPNMPEMNPTASPMAEDQEDVDRAGRRSEGRFARRRSGRVREVRSEASRHAHRGNSDPFCHRLDCADVDAKCNSAAAAFIQRALTLRRP